MLQIANFSAVQVYPFLRLGGALFDEPYGIADSLDAARRGASSAGAGKTVRIQVEPAEIVISPGQTVMFRTKGFESPLRLVG